MDITSIIFGGAIGYVIGILVGYWMADSFWHVLFRKYSAEIRMVIKSHDCGLARRQGWTLEDEAASTIEEMERAKPWTH